MLPASERAQLSRHRLQPRRRDRADIERPQQAQHRRAVQALQGRIVGVGE